jgi:outer membrane protein TolC
MTPYNPALWKGNNGETGMGQYMLSAQQFFPNKKRQNAETAYLQNISSVTEANKKMAQHDLYAVAKKNFFQWMVIEKKITVLNENVKLIDFMIKSAEIRYKNGIGKINAYYKAKAALGSIHNLKLMLQNERLQKKIMLNTLMQRSRLQPLFIDTILTMKDYSTVILDSNTLISSRSDIKAIDKQIDLNSLQQNAEKQKLNPEFGLRFDHMFGFGGFPQQFTLMAMAKIPLAKWSARSGRANIESLKWKSVALEAERINLINESLGDLYVMKSEIETRAGQIKVYEEEIIPALKRNYQTMQLAYGQNTEELFMLYDAWEKLYNSQQEYLDILQRLLDDQVELERLLEVKE